MLAPTSSTWYTSPAMYAYTDMMGSRDWEYNGQRYASGMGDVGVAELGGGVGVGNFYARNRDSSLYKPPPPRPPGMMMDNSSMIYHAHY